MWQSCHSRNKDATATWTYSSPRTNGSRNPKTLMQLAALPLKHGKDWLLVMLSMPGAKILSGGA
eukprot:4799266-Alexandrium_andersonii.AAC.1